MNANKQISYLKNHKSTMIGIRQSVKSSVCIPLISTNSGFEVLFEKRSLNIESQPGDICFPGGMVEPGETTQEAAVRELMEELNVSASQIDMIGLMDILSGNSIYIYPYAVELKQYRNTFSTDEVEEVLRVPLDFFLQNEPEIYVSRLKVIPPEDFPYERIYGGRNYAWRDRKEEILFYQYRDHTIWGLTAKIMHSFAQIWTENSKLEAE